MGGARGCVEAVLDMGRKGKGGRVRTSQFLCFSFVLIYSKNPRTVWNHR